MNAEFQILAEKLAHRGIHVEQVLVTMATQRIETPSWGYGNSGTRFKVFNAPGAARNVHEKLEDAALIHALSGIAPSVALHIPWDRTQDWEALRQYASDLRIEIGAINPNLFQLDEYKLGSVCHPSPSVRAMAVEHLVECCEIMRASGSKLLSVWLADGTNYAGQDDIRARRVRMLECLEHAYKAMPTDARMLLEYKFYEPAFYHTDIADWGTSFALCLRLGDRAQVLVDTGHHAVATNIPYVVAQLLAEERLGGFHFNSRNYGDDDLIVGAANPFELFVIYHELVSAGRLADQVAYMIDQSHNIEPKLEAMLHSVLNCQEAFLKALLVDRAALQTAQREGDVLGAHRVLMDAFQTDVRPILAQFRMQNDLPLDPIATLRAGGEVEKRVALRGSASESGGGYPG